MKNILITGAGSYIGESVRAYLEREPERYRVDVIDTFGFDPVPERFSAYDVVFNVAGIAHIKETDENRHLYYDVNRDLVIRIAEAAKASGVGQFILLSTMSVYGLTTGHVTKETPPAPVNAYGRSKAEADEAIGAMADDSFRFACLRPPMVYGKGCKGNYQTLRNFALKFPVFPDIENERSMIYIGNLCAFVKRVIDEGLSGLFFPQNAEYVNTSDLASRIALANGKKLKLTKIFNPALKLMRTGIVRKVFGSLTYDPVDTVDACGFAESVRLTEGRDEDA